MTTGRALDPDSVGEMGGAEDEDGRKWRQGAAAVIIAVILVLIVWWVLQSVGVVPATVGMSQRRSAERIHSAGFQSLVTTVPAGDRLAGRVIAQAPLKGLYFRWWPVRVSVTAAIGAGDDGSAAMRDIAHSGKYDLELGVGGQGSSMPFDAEEMDPLYRPQAFGEILMPDVQNLSETQALQSVRRVGLGVKIERGPSTTDVAASQIYYQDPAPGTRVSRGQVATLWISTGPFDIRDGSYPGGGSYPRPPGP